MTQKFSEGDAVILESTHHAHNAELKKNEGRVGEVVKRGSGRNADKALVRFEGRTADPLNRWWVADRWLAPSDRIDLKFAEAPRENAERAAADGHRAATVRYKDEKDIRVGDEIRLVDASSGEAFGHAEVLYARTMKARHAFEYIYKRSAMYTAQTEDEMMNALNYHYDGGIYPWTDVKVIVFKPEVR